MNDERLDLIALHERPEETSYDVTPQTFDDYIGQHELKDKLRIYTTAAQMRSEALDHALLFGPPGLGKTTLAHIIAKTMDVGIRVCSGPMLERTGDLVALLTSLEPRDVFFIDEIHRLPTQVEEVLYSAMEEFRVDVIIGQGAGAKSVSLSLNPFTLIGATTKTGMISAPLRSRFGIVERLDYYAVADLQAIILQTARFLKCDLTPDAALLVATCSRGTPRVAKKLTRRIRDFAQVKNANTANSQFTRQALSFLGIDSDGLSTVDNLILRALIEHFNGGPAGLDTLAALVGEDSGTLESVYEPFLMRSGYLEITSRGRSIVAKKIPFLMKKYLGQESLF